MATPTGPITLITSPRDLTIVPDPKVRYQSVVIGGRHYRLTPIAPYSRPAT